MNILILSASTGGGHMRAAKAISNYMAENISNAQVEIIDSLEYINPILNKTITNGYVYLATKTPKLYGKIYELTNKEKRWSNFVTTINNMVATKLLPLVDEYNPDAIITTHPFPTSMVSILKEKKLINIPLICIMTDYGPHKTWVNSRVDGYIVSNEDMVEEMKLLGVREEIIHPYGIPIEEVFFKKKDKEKVLKEIELDPEQATILMMAGSFGVTNVFNIYEEVINIQKPFQIIVVTGKNKKLYDEFSKITTNASKLTKLIYFTEEISKYMQASDIIITKPGGLTITEALACNIPMAIFDAIPGQEEDNAEFLINHNMAIKLENNISYSKVLEELLEDKDKLSKMKEACKSFEKNDSTKNITNLIEDFIESYKK